MQKPRLFIASSVEGLNIAQAVNSNLDFESESTLWSGGTFKLSSNPLEDLVRKASVVDFALFVFTPDDVAVIREREDYVVRDNVLFELGLFIGAIGKERCFILKPRGVEMRLPSDLLGLTVADYDPNRSDLDMESATNRACYLIKNEIKSKGLLARVEVGVERKIHANPPVYKVDSCGKHFLLGCLSSQTVNPTGVSLGDISNGIKAHSFPELQLSAIKLERMGLVSKTVERNHYQEEDYFSYYITDNGLDFLLSGEIDLSGFFEKVKEKSQRPRTTPGATPNFDSFDDDIPF